MRMKWYSDGDEMIMKLKQDENKTRLTENGREVSRMGRERNKNESRTKRE